MPNDGTETEDLAIYGQNVKLSPMEPGEHVTDVIVIARVVKFDDDGEIGDFIALCGSEGLTRIIERGMLDESVDFAKQLATGEND